MSEHPASWQQFVERACAEVGVDASLVDVEAILALAKVVAHEGERPMAPVSAFIAGLAAGQGLALDEAVRRIEATVAR